MHVARIAFGRRDAVAVDSDGTHVGRGAAYLSEAGFTLVVLYVDTRDAFQRITYVGVGELAYLIGGHYILDAEAVLLRIDGAALSLKGAAYHYFL